VDVAKDDSTLLLVSTEGANDAPTPVSNPRKDVSTVLPSLPEAMVVGSLFTNVESETPSFPSGETETKIKFRNLES
jgi:hypothetical protein